MDNYMVALEDISKSIKVGNKAKFSGSCGFNIDKIEIFVDGFKIGEANIVPGIGPVAWSTWSLEYSFTNGGNRLFLLTAKSKGAVVLNRFHTFNVEAETGVKPDVKPTSTLKIVESKVRHTTQGDMDCEGLIVHYTAGQQTSDPSGSIGMANDPGHAPYAYWVMASDGVVYWTHPTNRWGYHCGTYHHRTHLGIEIQCPGKLVKVGSDFYPWYNLDRTGNPKGPAWPKGDVRYFEGNELQTKGYYAKYTDEQEKSLVALVQYLKDHCPKFKIDNVLGHDEILPDYKDDPGGSLSMDMAAFREFLKKTII